MLFGIWILVGLVVYSWMAIKRKSDAEYQETVVFTPADIANVEVSN
jgi:hypothetical protein